MGLSESIDGWGDWNNGSSKPQGISTVQYHCKSKRDLSRIQIQLEGMKAQLQNSGTMPDSEAGRLRRVFEEQVDSYLLNLGYIFAKLKDFDLHDPKSLQQFYDYMEKTDWDKYAGHLRQMTTDYESLPPEVRKEIDMPSSAIGQMVGLCSYLSDCVTRLRALSSIETEVISVRHRLNQVLNGCAE